MDGLSAAASGLAVVSVAFQLAEGCKKLYDFWESVKDAPEEVSLIAHDLRVLSSVLEYIDRSGADSPSVTLVLNSCKIKMQPLHTMVANLERSFNSSSRRDRLWGAIRASSASRRLAHFRESLNDTKGTLTLGMICQNNNMLLEYAKALGAIVPVDAMPPPYTATVAKSDMVVPSRMVPPRPLDTESDKLNKIIAGHLQRAIEVGSPDLISTLPLEEMISDQVTKFKMKQHGAYNQDEYGVQVAPRSDLMLCCQLQHSSGYLSRASRIAHKTTSVGVLFGRLWQRTSTLRLAPKPGSANGEYEITTSFIFFPSSWLTMTGLGRGLEASLKNSRAGWTFDVNPIRAVPDNSLIFEYCSEGNWSEVERLLRRGDAHWKDTNSRGWTPLHFAAEAGHVDLAKRLIAVGADKRALAFQGPTKDALSPITIFVTANPDLPAEHKINMLRLFSDCLELTDPSGDGWTVHAELKRSYNREKVPIPENSISWLLRATASEPFVAFGPKTIWTALQSSVRSFLVHEQNEQLFQSLMGLSGEQKKNISNTRATSIAHWIALKASGRKLLSMVLDAGRWCNIKGFDWVEDDLTPNKFVKILPDIYHAWAVSFPNNVELVQTYMALELEMMLEKANMEKEYFLAFISQNDSFAESEKQHAPTACHQNDNVPRMRCSACQDDYSALGMGVVSPAWIAFQECIKTNHRHQCGCLSYLHANGYLCPLVRESPPPSKGSEYIYPFAEEDEDEEPAHKEESPSHQAELNNLCNIFIAAQSQHPTESSYDPFTEATTILYRAQGRTWLSKVDYGADETLCATCFLLREQYLGLESAEGEFPDMPASYAMCRAGEGEFCFDS
ncbi:hypothetical protein V8F06_013834 [Rhypophila decipiens]